MQLLIYYYFISFPPCNLLQLIATFYILCYESIDFEALCNKCCEHIKTQNINYQHFRSLLLLLQVLLSKVYLWFTGRALFFISNSNLIYRINLHFHPLISYFYVK